MQRHALAVDSCGLVQVVHLYWDKSARGGQGARDRNAVPQAFPVPEAGLGGAGRYLWIAESHWNGRNAFAAPFSDLHRRVDVANGYTHGCVSVSDHPDGLQVRYDYSKGKGGAPDRWFFSKTTGYGESPSRSLLVRPGEWVRVCYNGRFSELDYGDSSTWRYEQTTVNVAWFSGEPDSRVFLDREPSYELNFLADLW